MAQFIDYTEFMTPSSSRRKPSLTRIITKRSYGAKDVISLGEGNPNESIFPFEKIEISLKDGTSFALEGAQLGSALQYLPSQGYPPLLTTLADFMAKIHNPPNWQHRDLIITNGSQDGLSKALNYCVQEGDPIIVPDPFYVGTDIILRPFNPELIGVEEDHHGMSAQQLENILEDRKAKYTEAGGGMKMPKVLYINPTGSNPGGTTMPDSRRKEIYNICCKFNILILEDDPYCFMNFLEKLPVSFLSMDVQGRVIRFDSFSKVLSSGMRIGWVTAPKPVIANLELQMQSTCLHTNTLCQVIIQNLFENWGYDKFLQHLQFNSGYYKARRDITINAMERHLKGLCDWNVPSGGMFVWIKVRGVSDVYDMLMTRGLKKGIAFIPGLAFCVDKTKACSFIRASYSKATPKQIDKAMRLLADLIREELSLLRRKLDNLT